MQLWRDEIIEEPLYISIATVAASAFNKSSTLLSFTNEIFFDHSDGSLLKTLMVFTYRIGAESNIFTFLGSEATLCSI